MSEYWKSTPKYWCKHCSTFVRDTKLEKTNHEATPKHQGNLKRFLRDLHRGHEKDEKDKERAKFEVARLNGLVTGGTAAVSSSSSSSAIPRSSGTKPQATPSQRKQQLVQLAEMGVSIPDEFRPDMAMAGDWQVTSERLVDQDDGEKKPDALALGVRKRQLDEEEEVLEAKKRRWGSAYRTHPAVEEDDDLDALLGNATRKGKGPALGIEDSKEVKPGVKQEVELGVKDEVSSIEIGLVQSEEDQIPTGIKAEPPEGNNAVPVTIPPLGTGVKAEGEDQAVPGVVFKKRKAKNIRQK